MKLPIVLTLLAAAVPAFAQTGATPAEKITVAPGFKVELLKSADPKRDGSWISMAIDAKGRLYISPQGAIPESGFGKDSKWGGLVRVTLAPVAGVNDPGHSTAIAEWERVPVPIGDSMGMLWAFDSLYVSGNGPEGRGIYRLTSEGISDQLDTWTMWKKVPGGAGEHGAHALVLGPDGKSIYIVHGNSTPLIIGIAPDSPYKNYREDDLLPRVLDPVATFFDKLKAPYGHILRTDEKGTKWELFAGGFRNPYDIDFNADGELFTYDSDMEWDAGLPWFRPTRVLHVVPGGEYGFREGSAKWPAWYPDSLPAAVDIGLGCPTGVKFGTRSRFPEKYRRAFFIMDWTFGRILAVHLHPRGASYTASMEPAEAGGKRSVASAAGPGTDGAVPSTATPPKAASSSYHPKGPSAGGDVEVFLSGKGLPVTDLEFGNDGAMYFTIGGRGTQAGLYRVSWTAEKPAPAFVEKHLGNGEEAFTRESLVRMKEHSGTRYAVGECWPSLGHTDQFIAFAARTMLEGEAIDSWRGKALSEAEPQAALTALLALARVGTKEDQAAILQALAKFPLDSLSEELKLEKLRVIEVALARHGRPSPELVQMGLEKLLRQYPAKTFALNRELCQLLVYLSQPVGPSGGPVGASGGRVEPSGRPVESSRGPVEPSGRPVESSRGPVEPSRGPVEPSRGPVEPSRGPVEPSRKSVHSISGQDFMTKTQKEVLERTLALMETSPEPAEQVWYALCLREAAGWTPAQREQYFAWFAKARGYKGGNSLGKFILRIRDQALEKVPAADRPALLALAEKAPAVAGVTDPGHKVPPPRAFVKAWTLDDLLPALPEADKGRNFARGKALYTAAQCAQCHPFAGEGGATGPDLTAVGSRFSRKDILEATLEPSKALSEQYASFLFTLKDGSTVGGQIAEENNDVVYLLPNPLSNERRMLSQTRIAKREMSPVSLMPPGLLSTFTKDEVLDLLAYLESGGNEKAPAFGAGR